MLLTLLMEGLVTANAIVLSLEQDFFRRERLVVS
jgi:hypothetical protein